MNTNGNPFHAWIQLEQPRLGTEVTYATDEFFAARERLIQPEEPIFIPNKYDEHGKWMDGWESRRRRTPGHDFCIVRLGVPGVLRGVDIDTRHFTGNYPPQASLDACVSDDDVPAGEWTEIIANIDLRPDAHHYLAVADDSVWTHVRLNIYPDGGVARLRLYGVVRPDFSGQDGKIDLLALENGGRAVACSDEHFGSMHNLNAPGRGFNMGDGWETARRRGPGNDWVIFELGHPGVIDHVELDTEHFKGNYPDSASIEAAYFDDVADVSNDSEAWQTLLPPMRLEADNLHVFEGALEKPGPVSHVRLSIYPDGGVSRLRLFGHVARGRPE